MNTRFLQSLPHLRSALQYSLPAGVRQWRGVRVHNTRPVVTAVIT